MATTRAFVVIVAVAGSAAIQFTYSLAALFVCWIISCRMHRTPPGHRHYYASYFTDLQSVDSMMLQIVVDFVAITFIISLPVAHDTSVFCFFDACQRQVHH